MTIHTQKISFGDATLLLTNQKCIFIEEVKMLLLADLHIGKSAHFRKHGMAIPDGVVEKDLKRLQKIIQHFRAEKVVIIGDLFHAEINSELDFFKKWLLNFPDVKFILVDGNHDRHTKKSTVDFNLTRTKEFFHQNISLQHIPSFSDEFQISGHIHPGTVINSFNGQKIKLPCYLVAEKNIILPAFSDFCGLDTQYAKKQKTSFNYWLITDKKLVAYP